MPYEYRIRQTLANIRLGVAIETRLQEKHTCLTLLVVFIGLAIWGEVCRDPYIPEFDFNY